MLFSAFSTRYFVKIQPESNIAEVFFDLTHTLFDLTFLPALHSYTFYKRLTCVAKRSMLGNVLIKYKICLHQDAKLLAEYEKFQS